MNDNNIEMKAAPMEQNKNGYQYPKNSWGRWILGVLFPLAVFLGTSIVAGLVLAIYGLIVSAGDAEAMQRILLHMVVPATLAQNLIALAVLVPVYFSQKKKNCFPTNKVKLNAADFAVYGVMLTIGFSTLISSGITLLFELLNVSDAIWENLSGMIHSGSLVMQILAVGIGAPFAEEFVFRGMLQNRLASKLPKWAALLITAAVFGIFHGNATQFINAFLAGLLIGFMYMQTGSLWLCITAHMANNIFSVLYVPLGIDQVSEAVQLVIAACFVAFAVFYNLKLKKNTRAAQTSM